MERSDPDPTGVGATRSANRNHFLPLAVGSIERMNGRPGVIDRVELDLATLDCRSHLTWLDCLREPLDLDRLERLHATAEGRQRARELRALIDADLARGRPR